MHNCNDFLLLMLLKWLHISSYIHEFQDALLSLGGSQAIDLKFMGTVAQMPHGYLFHFLSLKKDRGQQLSKIWEMK